MLHLPGADLSHHHLLPEQHLSGAGQHRHLGGAGALRLLRCLRPQAGAEGETYAGQPHQRKRDLFLALVATGYGCWLVYAAGVEYLLLVALLYSPGIFIYWKARQHHGLRGLNRLEQGMTAALLGCAVLAFYKVMDGTIPLS